ncbi:MAG: hypothetical protein K2G87_06385, partial [Oscillospiraceae bacterium]|nr:hypothetical protein [Oscillospiraceae bacterium]
GVSLLKEGDVPPPAEEKPAAKPEAEPAAKELAPESDIESAYDRMMKIRPDNKQDISDVELFG